jgi:sugar O-acyltransferase (sialic acid O-acetyltransferase NeuD family)
MKEVLIIGGQGSGSVIGDSIIDANKRGDREYKFAGYINDRDQVSEIEGMPVLGGIKDIPKFIDQGYFFIYTIYKFECQPERTRLFDSLKIPESQLATFIHPTAYVAHNVVFSPGCVVMANVSITSSTTFGKSCIVRPGATIGHNNKIGNHVSIIAGASVGSLITIEDGATIGLKACVREYITIGKYSMAAMGAVVVKNIGEAELWAGNPAKFIRHAEWYTQKGGEK